MATAVVFVLLWVFDGAKMGNDKNNKIPQVQCFRRGHIFKGSAWAIASPWCRAIFRGGTRWYFLRFPSVVTNLPGNKAESMVKTVMPNMNMVL